MAGHPQKFYCLSKRFVVNATEEDEYCALSYVWGDIMVPPATYQIGGVEWKVPESAILAFNALSTIAINT